MSDDDKPVERVVVTDVRIPMDSILRLTIQVMWVGLLLGLLIGIVWVTARAVITGGAY